MATLIITLATLYIEYIVYDHPAVVLGTVCLHLFFTRCSEYLRKRRFVRYYKQITNGGMDSSVPVEDRRGVMVGAWGFKFFECDHDCDIAAHLSADMGLCEENPYPRMQDSLLNPKNRNFVAQHVSKPTELDRVFKKYLGMLQDYEVINIKATRKEGIMIDSPRYYIFLLGLLAMQLGCTLSRKHRRWMEANWDSCLFMYERLDQAKMAALEYQNGTPLKLDSKTLHEKGRTLAATEQLNVPNNAIQASMMRMRLDNEVAKANGATATRSVDISNAFAHNAAYVAAIEQIAVKKAKHSVKKAKHSVKKAKHSVKKAKHSVKKAKHSVKKAKHSVKKDSGPETPTASTGRESTTQDEHFV